MTMNRCLLIVAMALVQSGCNRLVRIATEQAQPLSYVGQIAFGEPTAEDDHVAVPLTYSRGDWDKNSAIVASSIDAVVDVNTIEFTVMTSVANSGQGNGHRLVLPPGTQGKYTVYYRDPDTTRHEIGTLVINPRDL